MHDSKGGEPSDEPAKTSQEAEASSPVAPAWIEEPPSAHDSSGDSDAEAQERQSPDSEHDEVNSGPVI